MKKNTYIIASSISAGILIGFGGLLYILSRMYLERSGIIVGALLFSFALYLICRLNITLYTGKIGYLLDKQYSIKQFILMLVGNLFGAALIGIMSHWLWASNEQFQVIINSIVQSKAIIGGVSVLGLIVKSILCGVLVYLAVHLYKSSIDGFEKFLSILIPIFIFVVCGFEHCIANIFYFFASLNNFFDLICNLVLVIIGNSVGAIVTNYLIRFQGSESLKN